LFQSGNGLVWSAVSVSRNTVDKFEPDHKYLF
jgi:hypothetical protein